MLHGSVYSRAENIRLSVSDSCQVISCIFFNLHHVTEVKSNCYIGALHTKVI